MVILMLEQFKKDIFVDQYSCSRLTSDREHNALIKYFTSRKSLTLPMYLQQHAWLEDKRNYRAYYLVKEGQKIVCYFSLQCGLLVKCHKKILGGVVCKELNGKNEYIIDSDKIEVSAVVPAVELAHFCINDTYRRKKKTTSINYGICDYSIGVYVFYRFIAPIIIELSEKVGLEYVYLFSADDWSGRLTNYYTEQLNFRIMDDMACIRPDYDDELECLTIRIVDLARDVNRFEDFGRAQVVLDYLNKKGTISNFQARREIGIRDPEYLFCYLVNKGFVLSDCKDNNGRIVRIKHLRG